MYLLLFVGFLFAWIPCSQWSTSTSVNMKDIVMFIITFGEMLAWPSVPAAAAELAPPYKRGFYQGIIGSFGSGGRMFGVLLAGLLYEIMGISKMYILMLVILAVSMLFFFDL